MAHRSIGQERFGFSGQLRSGASLNELAGLIDWQPIAVLLEPLYPSAKGELGWPPLAMFKALLLSVWYDLSGVQLAEALDDRASFRRFCGFSGTEPTPERTAFVPFRLFGPDNCWCGFDVNRSGLFCHALQMAS